MASLDTIVNVTVTANTKTVSRAGFGTPMVLSYHTANLDRYKIYTNAGFPTNMTDDGFTTSDTAYQAVAAIFAQNPAPPQVVVGRRSNAPTQTTEFIPTPVAQGFVHSMTVTSPAGVSETYTVTEGASSTIAALCTSFTTAIGAGALAITPTDNITNVSVAANTAGEFFSYTGLTPSITTEDVTADAGVAADFNAVLAEYSDFYGVYLDSQARDENIALAAAVATQDMIQVASGFSHSNLDSGSTDGEAYGFQNSAYNRSSFWFTQDHQAHLGAALLGRCLPSQPGFITWAYKTLAGVPADSLSATQQTALEGFNGNWYQTVGGQNITFEGNTGVAGQFLDVTRTTDWASARTQEAVYQVLVNADKIPFTDKGGAVLKGAILAALNAGVREDDSGAFTADPAPSCIVPAVDDIVAADKSARNFTGITFSATLTGAAHTVTVNGTLSL